MSETAMRYGRCPPACPCCASVTTASSRSCANTISTSATDSCSGWAWCRYEAGETAKAALEQRDAVLQSHLASPVGAVVHEVHVHVVVRCLEACMAHGHEVDVDVIHL